MGALNYTENYTITGHPEDEEDDGDQKEGDEVTNITFACAYVIIIMFSLAGNSLVIHLVRTRKNIRKNPFNWLLVNMAVADVMDVISASAFSVPYFFVRDQWIPGVVGTILCKIIPFFLVVSIGVAIWTLTVIAADRYLAIVCIRRRPLSFRSVLGSIVAVWLCAGLIFSGQLYKFKTEKLENGESVCYEDWHDSEQISNNLYNAEMVLRVVITYAVPLIIMAVLYSLIAYFLWRHKPPGHVNQQAYAKQAKKRRDVIKMLITAVTVFAICWLPVHVTHIMMAFFVDAYVSIPDFFKWLFIWLAHANAAIHPWLFIAFSENLRVETKAIFRFLWIREQGRFQQPRLSTSSQQVLGFSSLELRASRYLAPSTSSIDISNLGIDTKF